MNANDMWTAVLERDKRHDKDFVYAVRTTGIFCRPTCPSRRPHRDNVEFFDDPAAAQDSGYRPCKRCNPIGETQAEPNRDLVVQICRYLEGEHDRAPTLDDLAERFALSAFHLQRTFKRIVGVSPRQYFDAVRQGRLKQLLKDRPTVTEALYAAGYSGSSRLYEQAGHTMGMTPINYRKGGEMMTIQVAVVPCSLGLLLVAATDVGVCKISIGDVEKTMMEELAQEFHAAQVTRDDTLLAEWVGLILDYIEHDGQLLELPLDIQATSFQRRVWEALRAIPYGATRSYKDVAEAIGQPTASRAVATACASNPVAMAIPCHRILRSNGEISGYRWGVERKEYLLAHEQQMTEASGE